MSSGMPWDGVPDFPGPRAARHATILRMLWMCKDPIKKEALGRALGELYASAWEDPIPDEDREWVLSYRERVRRNWELAMKSFAGQWAYDGYLKSSGGTFEEKPVLPYEMAKAAWTAFGERVRHAPAEESELETVEAAVAAYADCSEQLVPPCSDHWLAALRAVRKGLTKALTPRKG